MRRSGCLAIAAIASVIAAWASGPATAATGPPVEVKTTLTPQILLFGDTLTARVDVVVDKARVDPDSVRVRTDFVPWELVAPVERVRRDGRGTALVRTTFQLRCLTSPCVPPRDTAPLDFDAAAVNFAGGRLDVPWPRLVVHSRIPDRNAPVTTAGGGQRGGPQFPWTADLLTLPQVTYRVGPGILFPLLLALGAALALGGALLGYRAVPPRRPAPEPLPAPPPEPALAPLELALLLLEQPPVEDGTADRRRALELVADALADRDARLALSARRLAWSEDTPPVETTSGLASRARAVLFPQQTEPEPEEVDA
jgi:hypothetical protein